MSLSSLRNSRGLTLVELAVAMAISSVLLAAMVSASLFVQRYITNWQKKDVLAEELASVSQELTEPIETARIITIYGDSVRMLSGDMTRTTFDWHTGRLMRNGHNMTRSGLRIDSLSIVRSILPKQTQASTLRSTNHMQATGLYELFVRISSARGMCDSLRVVVRNEYEFQKYQEK